MPFMVALPSLVVPALVSAEIVSNPGDTKALPYDKYVRVSDTSSARIVTG